MDSVIEGKVSTCAIRNDPPSKETLFGAVQSEEECLKIIDMRRAGVLPMVLSRLTEEERKIIRPGSIFVYEEEESGISRWTDGRPWTSSKVHGSCLIYHEIFPVPSEDHISARAPKTVEEIMKLGKEAISNELPLAPEKARRKDSLIKLAASVSYQAQNFHLISYSNKLFSRDHSRSYIWNMVGAWEIPYNFELKMSYRRKRPSLSQSAQTRLVRKPRKAQEQKSHSYPSIRAQEELSS